MPQLPIRPEQEILVRSRMKRQTIRRVRRKNPIKPGDILKFAVRRDRRTVDTFMVATCTEVVPVRMGIPKRKVYVEIDGKEASPMERLELAQSEGFAGTRDMIDHFKKRFMMPGAKRLWQGVIIRW